MPSTGERRGRWGLAAQPTVCNQPPRPFQPQRWKSGWGWGLCTLKCLPLVLFLQYHTPNHYGLLEGDGVVLTVPRRPRCWELHPKPCCKAAPQIGHQHSARAQALLFKVPTAPTPGHQNPSTQPLSTSPGESAGPPLL